MSKSVEQASDEELGGPPTGSVFDFLYHDARRVASFLSQLDDSGNLTGLKRIEGAEKSANRKIGATASGGIPTVVQGGANMEGQSTATERETLERTYDPIWTNAIALLDLLDERGIIRDGLAEARIGQFVKVSGSLNVTDLSLWQGLWKLPVVQMMIAAETTGSPTAGGLGPLAPPNMQSRQGRKDARQGSGGGSPPSAALPPEVEMALSVLGVMPHTIQARLEPDVGGQVWCSLQSEGLVVSASDLTLKHAVTVPGTWTMVGVLDAQPDLDEYGMPTAGAIGATAKTQTDGAATISGLITGLSPMFRSLLGRPQQAYGMTPLVIFRNVAT